MSECLDRKTRAYSRVVYERHPLCVRKRHGELEAWPRDADAPLAVGVSAAAYACGGRGEEGGAVRGSLLKRCTLTWEASGNAI